MLISVQKKFAGVVLLFPAFLQTEAAPAAATQTSASVDFAKILPKDTLVFARVHDLSSLKKRAEAAGLKKILEQKEVQQFFEHITQQIERARKLATAGPEALRDVKFEDVIKQVEGDVCFALGNPSIEKLMKQSKEAKDSKAPPKEIAENMFLFLDAKGQAKNFEEVFNKLIQAGLEDGGKKEEETYKGARIVTLSSGKESEPAMVLCRSGNWFAFSGGNESLKAAVRRSQDNAGDSLSNNPKYLAVQKNLDQSPDIAFYADIESVLQAFNAGMQLATAEMKLPEGMKNPVEAIVSQAVKTLGADSLKAIGASFTARDQKFTFKSHAYFPQGPTGLLKALCPTGSSVKIPDYIDENVEQFGAGKFDFPLAYDSIIAFAGIILQAQGQPIDPEQFAKMMLGIELKSIRNDVLGNLTGEYFTTGKVSINSEHKHDSKPEDEDEDEDEPQLPGQNMTQEWSWVLPVKDGSKLFEKLSELLEILGQKNPSLEPKEEDYLGSKLMQFSDIVLAIKSNQLVLGTAEMGKAVLRRMGSGGKTLAENAAYKELAVDLPGSYQSLGFQSPEATEKALTAVKDTLTFMQSMKGKMTHSSESDEDFDLISKLPDPKIFTQYLVGTISYGLTTGEGQTNTITLKLKKAVEKSEK